MRTLVAIATLALLGLASRPALAQHDHHHHTDHADHAPAAGDAPVDEPRPFELGVIIVGGRFDQTFYEGDYAGATLATRAGDRLDACAESFREGFVHDPWVARRLPALVRAVGLRVESIRSHGYVEALVPGFMLGSWADMGADALAATGRVEPSAAAELKAEARRRIASGEYFGHIAYVSVVARHVGS